MKKIFLAASLLVPTTALFSFEDMAVKAQRLERRVMSAPVKEESVAAEAAIQPEVTIDEDSAEPVAVEEDLEKDALDEQLVGSENSDEENGAASVRIEDAVQSFVEDFLNSNEALRTRYEQFSDEERVQFAGLVQALLEHSYQVAEENRDAFEEIFNNLQELTGVAGPYSAVIQFVSANAESAAAQ